jgi:uncharacterized protein YjeT (DUF2065 family)
MSLDWSDLLAAFGLCLIIEGILPFLNPNGVRRAFAMLLTVDNRVLRIIGAITMALGLALIYLVRS